jgi:hypothetical protein
MLLTDIAADWQTHLWPLCSWHNLAISTLLRQWLQLLCTQLLHQLVHSRPATEGSSQSSNVTYLSVTWHHSLQAAHASAAATLNTTGVDGGITHTTQLWVMHVTATQPRITQVAGGAWFGIIIIIISSSSSSSSSSNMRGIQDVKGALAC